MVISKHITKIIIAVMVLAVCLCLAAAVFSEQLAPAAGDKGLTMEYESALFDTSEIIRIDIVIDEDDWNEMLDNATAEEYYRCDVTVNGETFYGVGIRPKGNTSLTTIAADPTTDRYSFKLEFDHYVDGQTCFGLDKLVLNNNYADATNMKEALIYDMYQYLGADASLYNYAKISVNGAYWGVYLAIEAVEDSFLLRNYGTQDGELYKPDSMNIGGFDMGDMDMGDFSPSDMPGGGFGFSQFPGEMPEGSEAPEAGPSDGSPEDGGSPSQLPDGGSFDFGDMDPGNMDLGNMDFGGMDFGGMDFGGMDFGGMDFGGFSLGGGGADLNYTGDDLDSYSTIWEGEVTKTKDADHRRVVTALKNISEGTDLASYMDIDNLLRYMAVHIFSVNEDSLSGMMAHNYYLYEYDGQLNIIPWDYNLALGGMSGSNATSVVNEAIDNAFSGTEFFDTLMENEAYHQQYYAYMTQLVEEYINGGGFDAFYDRVRSQIDALVETDPNAFYTYEEYLTAAETLYEVVQLRGKSISGQLNGSIPSTSAEQSGSDALIDASHIDLEVMGSMDIGGGFSFGGQDANGNQADPAASNEGGSSALPESFGAQSGGFDFPQVQGEPPEDLDASQFGNFDPSQFGDLDPSQFGEGTPESGESPAGDASQPPNGAPDAGANATSFPSSEALLQYGLSLAVIAIAFVFAVFYRRKPRRR